MKIKQLGNSSRFFKKHKAFCLIMLFLCLGFSGFAQEVSINAISNAKEEGQENGSFIIRARNFLILGSTISYTVTGTATEGDDYSTLSRSVSVTNRNQNIPVDISGIVNDSFTEGDETIIITIESSISYTINSGAGVATIVIEDNEPVCGNTPNAPQLNTTEPTIFCEGFTQDLDEYVTDTPPAGTILRWSRSTDLLDEDSYLSSSEIGSRGVYYGFFLNESSACTSPPLKITIVENENPEITETFPDSTCGSGDLTLSATSAGSLKWYDSLTADTPVYEGVNFLIEGLTTTTSYYVEATANGCTSDRVEVIATINEQPSSGTGADTTACSLSGNGRVTIVNLDDQLTGQDAGEWTLTSQPAASNITIDANTVDFVGQPLGEYEFTYTTTGFVAPCTSETTTITITVIDCNPTETDLAIVKTVDKNEVFSGEEVTFTITATNLTGDPVTDIEITDVLDASTGFEYISDNTLVGSFDSTTGVWTIPQLDAGEAATITITTLVLDSGSHINTATITSSDPLDTTTENNQSSAEVVIKQIDLSVTKRADKMLTAVGEEVTFTIVLTNETDGLVTDISITDLIEDAIGFQYVSHTTTTGTYNPISGIWLLSEILGNEEQILEITTRVIEEGTHINSVEITDSFPLDVTFVENNRAEVTISIAERTSDECGFLFNQFSPNGDGINDYLRINCIEDYPNNTLTIFNRLGSEVYSVVNYDNKWDGTWKKGALPNGTYFYVLDLADGSEVKRGWIQIIR